MVQDQPRLHETLFEDGLKFLIPLSVPDTWT